MKILFSSNEFMGEWRWSGVLSKQRRLIPLQSEIVCRLFKSGNFYRPSQPRIKRRVVYSCGTNQLWSHFLGLSGRNGTTLTYALLLLGEFSPREAFRQKKGCELIFIASQRTANCLCPEDLMVPPGCSTTVWWPPRRERNSQRMHLRNIRGT